MGSRVMKDVPNEKWKEVFAWANVQGMTLAGEKLWETMIGAAKKELERAGVNLNSPREMSIFALGLYMGASYGKQVAEILHIELPECPPSEQA